jgi:hypothetical protein
MASLRHLRAAAVLILGLAATDANATASVSTSGTAGASELELSGTRIVKIADVTLETDATSGLNATVSAGVISKPDARTPIAIQVVLVADGAAPPGAGAFTAAAGVAFTLQTTSAGSVEKDLYIRYSAATFQDPGTYSAVIHVDALDN